MWGSGGTLFTGSVIFQKNTNIGINIAHPVPALHINKPTDYSANVFLLGDTRSGEKGIRLHYNNDPASGRYENAVIDTRARLFALRGVAPSVGGDASIERFTIDLTNGNVGIGTQNPQSKFHILDHQNHIGGEYLFNGSQHPDPAYIIWNRAAGAPTSANYLTEGVGASVAISMTDAPNGFIWSQGPNATTSPITDINHAQRTDLMMLTPQGWLRIGKNPTTNPHYNTTTDQPKAHLDVRGDAIINGHHIGRGGGNSSYNLAFGKDALKNTQGAWNLAFGRQALEKNTIGTNNSAVGNYALINSITGRNNTAIGVGAGSNLISGDGNIAIGANANFLSATASNQLNIGNWIYGNNGDIGIATPHPTNALTITKNADVHGTQTTPNNGTILIQDDPRTNIGYKLFMDANEIQATTGSTPTGLALNPYGGTINIGGSSGALASPENASFLFNIPQTSIGQLRFMQSTEANYIQSGIGGRHGDAKDLRFTPIGATRPWMSIVAQTGNVGINTNNPQSKLHINGNIQLGNENNTCNPTAEGQMRYSRTLKAMEYCDGAQWKSVGQGTPRGAIMAFYRSTCPAGWIPANGTNGTPDLRGEFIRGWDNGRGIDVGRGFGSFQGDAIRNITGKTQLGWDADIPILPSDYTMGAISLHLDQKWNDTLWNSTMLSGPGHAAWNAWMPLSFDASRVVPTANENRPRNIALLYCMKE